MLRFVKSIVVTLPVSRTQSRVGAVLFSTNPFPLFRFGQLNTITHVQQAIDSIRYPRGKTYIGKALAYTRRFLFGRRRQRNRKRVLIMLTDGISQDRVGRQASLLKAKGVEVFVAEETTVVADCHRQEPCFCCIVQRVGCFIKDDKVQNLSACPTYRLVHECCTDMSLG